MNNQSVKKLIENNQIGTPGNKLITALLKPPMINQSNNNQAPLVNKYNPDSVQNTTPPPQNIEPTQIGALIRVPDVYSGPNEKSTNIFNTESTDFSDNGLLIHKSIITNIKKRIEGMSKIVQTMESAPCEDPLLSGLYPLKIKEARLLVLLADCIKSEFDKPCANSKPFVPKDIRMDIEKEITNREIGKMKIKLEIEKIRSGTHNEKVRSISEVDDLEDSDRPLKKRKIINESK